MFVERMTERKKGKGYTYMICINAKVEHSVGRTWVVRVLPSHGRVDSPFCALTSAELCNKESGSIHIAENAQEKGGKGRPGTMLSDCHTSTGSLASQRHPGKLPKVPGRPVHLLKP